ncbi:MAG: hypothetical protein DRN30_02800 [Thermoplasmata archaeon]|nr:hypothetical protein [Euryarchaeota archaeon]RLF66077.1 MAG: hypothetical protein DRN30_02800 [Thermoplasmata archaeon]
MSSVNKALKELFENELYSGVRKLLETPSEIQEKLAELYINSIDKALEVREEILSIAKARRNKNLVIQSLDQYSEWKVATINMISLEYDLKFLWPPDVLSKMAYDEKTDTVLRDYIIQYWFRRPEEISIYIPIPALKGDYAPWIFEGEYLFDNVYYFMMELFKSDLKKKKPNAWRGLVATIRLFYHHKVAPQEVIEYAFDNFEDVREWFASMKLKYAKILAEKEPLMPIKGLESYYEAPRHIAEKFKVNPKTFKERIEISEKYGRDYIKTLINELGEKVPI